MRTLDLVRRMDPDRFRFDFAVLSGRGGHLDDRFRALGGRIHYLGMRSGSLRVLADLFRGKPFDIVHSHVHYMSGVVLSAARMAGVPVRVAHFRSTHDGHAATLRRRAQRSLMKRLIDRNATALFAVSEAAMSAAWGDTWVGDARCSVVYNGFDLDRFASVAPASEVRARFGIPKRSPLIVHVGRFVPAKNHQRLVEIFAGLAEQLDDARLLLVGESANEVEHSVRALVKRLGLVRRVHFVGLRDDVPDILASADLLLLPSLWEGLSGAALEGCATGIPVCTSDLPSNGEIAAHFPGVTLVPLDRSDVEWCRSAMRALRAGRSPNAVEHFRKTPFSMKCAVDRITSKYELALRSVQGRPGQRN